MARILIWKPPRRKGQLYFRAQQIVDFARRSGCSLTIVEDRGRQSSTWGKISSFIKYIAEMRSLLLFDIVVLFPHIYLGIVAAVGRVLGKRLILDHYVTQITHRDNKALPKLARLIGDVLDKVAFRAVDIVIAHTTMMKEELVTYYSIEPNKAKVVYPVLDTQLFSPVYASEAAGLKEQLGITGKKIVMYHGMHHPWHGLSYLIKAARTLRTRRDIVFVIIPRGECFHSDEENILFLDHVPYQDLPKYIQTCDVWASGFDASLRESYVAIGSCLLQAMAMGKPVITSEIGERSIFKDSENVFFVAPENPNEIAKKILFCIQNMDFAKKVGTNARKLVQSKFTIDVMNSVLDEAMFRI